MSTTGERLRLQRKRREISADEVAVELGVSRSTIFRYENGYIEKVPSNILEKLADILYTTPAYLAGWTDDYHDWERIGNDQGIYPPTDYEGNYEDYVKYKVMQESDDAENYEDYVKYKVMKEFDDMELPSQKGSSQILQYYEKLNDIGKHEATKRVEELTYIPQYVKEDTEDYLKVNAAHARTGIDIPEDADISEDDIMDDENF